MRLSCGVSVMQNEKGYNKRIEEMHREKNRRIAKQVALKAAVDVVSISEPSKLLSPEKLSRKVVDVAEEFYRWLEGRE